MLLSLLLLMLDAINQLLIGVLWLLVEEAAPCHPAGRFCDPISGRLEDKLGEGT